MMKPAQDTDPLKREPPGSASRIPDQDVDRTPPPAGRPDEQGGAATGGRPGNVRHGGNAPRQKEHGSSSKEDKDPAMAPAKSGPDRSGKPRSVGIRSTRESQGEKDPRAELGLKSPIRDSGHKDKGLRKDQ